MNFVSRVIVTGLLIASVVGTQPSLATPSQSSGPRPRCNPVEGFDYGDKRAIATFVLRIGSCGNRRDIGAVKVKVSIERCVLDDCLKERTVRVCPIAVNRCGLSARIEHDIVEAATYSIATSYVSEGTSVIGGFHTEEHFCYSPRIPDVSGCD